MGKTLFWKVACQITLGLMLTNPVYGATDILVGTLSEGACWFENKESIRVASFNDKTAYSGNRDQIESDLNALIAKTLLTTEHSKIRDMDLSLHCGGYGSSLVAKVSTDNNSYCLWTKFEEGNLSLRSIGVVSIESKNSNELCDGHKWGEFLIGSNSEDLIVDLQSPKWSSMIKSVELISKNVYKIILVKDYEFREQEIIDLLKTDFNGKDFIRYIEFNDYRHPVGEFTHLK